MTENKEIELMPLDKKAMGQRIRSRREAKNLTREKLAEDLGVSAQFIGDVEYGHKGIALERFYALSQLLGVTTDYLLAGNIYDQKKEPETQQVCEEIMGMLDGCDAVQLKGIRDITEIYVDNIKSK
jgi:transcriptional regulator with XRE-family HTH domain